MHLLSVVARNAVLGKLLNEELVHLAAKDWKDEP